jgi:hypothetical protein
MCGEKSESYGIAHIGYSPLYDDKATPMLKWGRLHKYRISRNSESEHIVTCHSD